MQEAKVGAHGRPVLRERKANSCGRCARLRVRPLSTPRHDATQECQNAGGRRYGPEEAVPGVCGRDGERPVAYGDTWRRPRILLLVGVIGGGTGSLALLDLARQVGQGIAARGAGLICGGLGSPIITLQSWELELPSGGGLAPVYRAHDASDAVERALTLAGACGPTASPIPASHVCHAAVAGEKV